MAAHLGDDLIAKVVYTVGKNTPKVLGAFDGFDRLEFIIRAEAR
jgi:hypothetical protein